MVNGVVCHAVCAETCEQDLDFANPTRKVVHEGALLRQNEPLKRGWKELWVVLFDNYRACRSSLLYHLPKPKPKHALSFSDYGEAEGQRRRHEVRRMEGCEHPSTPWCTDDVRRLTPTRLDLKPVRLEFLSLASLTVRPVQRSNTLSRMIRTGRDSPDPLSSLEHILDTINPNRDSSNHATTGTYYPLSFSAHGKHGGAYTLYASTLTERNEWRRKIREAVAARMKAQADRSVFQVETITSDTASSQDAPAHQPGLVTGRISCSLPFSEFYADESALVRPGAETGG